MSAASFVVILPVKPPALGKSRLRGLPDAQRRDLAAALDEVAGPTFVRDAAGTGTTAYAAPTDRFDPHFGPASAAHHLAGGAREVVAPVPTLRLDVDDLGDLGGALVLGVGPRTDDAMSAGGSSDSSPT